MNEPLHDFLFAFAKSLYGTDYDGAIAFVNKRLEVWRKAAFYSLQTPLYSKCREYYDAYTKVKDKLLYCMEMAREEIADSPSK